MNKNHLHKRKTVTPSDPTPEQLSIEMGGTTLYPGDYIGSYRYIRSVGKGGMADVLLASDPSNKQFALKVLKASRFQTGRGSIRERVSCSNSTKTP